MAQAPAPQEQQEKPRRREPAEQEPKTHLIGRTRGNRDFRRGGVMFTPQYQAFALADFGTTVPEDQRWGKGKSQLDAIVSESMLEIHIVGASEAKKYEAVASAEFDPNVSRADLIQHIQKQDRKLTALTERLAQLETAMMADRPPKKPNEMPPETPTPPNLQQR